jgi:drug/metabolite transporter (DMT)-like permease
MANHVAFRTGRPAPFPYPSGMTQDRILPGVGLMLAFCVLAPLLDVASKLAAQSLPVGQITGARFLVQGVLMLPIAMFMGISLRLDRRMTGFIILRAVFLILSTYTFVAGIAIMPVADALAIAFVEPFILLILGSFLFGDVIGPRRIAACAVGFGGALLVIQPSLAAFGTIALYPLGTAFFFAFYMLITRHMSQSMHPVAMQLHTSLAGSAICLPALWLLNGSGIPSLDSVPPQGIAWLWLFGVGFWAALSHICMTYALKFAPTSTLAPLHYLEIVAAVALGYLVFNDFPNAMTWAGIAVIVSSGLYIIHREHRVARDAARAISAPTH